MKAKKTDPVEEPEKQCDAAGQAESAEPAEKQTEDIKTEEVKRPHVKGVAYSGGKMRLGGWSLPVVVDLAGMQIPEQIPLLMNHENETAKRVGLISAKVENNCLMIDGEVLSESKEAADIVAQAQKGGTWQLSIGADVEQSQAVKEEEKRNINGVECEGPFYAVTASVLREVSVVAVGADASTAMNIAAKFNLFSSNQGGEIMSEKDSKETKVVKAEATPKVEAVAPAIDVQAAAAAAAETAVQAERKRVSDIQDVCAGEFADIQAEAISAGWSADETRIKVLAAFRAKQPAASVNVIVKDNSFDAKHLEAAFAIRAGVSSDTLTKSYGEDVVDKAMSHSDMSLKELMVECSRLEGITCGRTFDNSTIQAAFSSVSLPGILSNVANKRLLDAYTAQPVIANKLCSIGDLNDFKETDRLRLTDVGDLLPVAADGEIKEGGLTEEKATNQLETYGKKFCLTRKMIINDDLGAFLQVPTGMGNRAARLLDQLFFKRLLANPTQGDSKALFHADHKNLLTGSTSALAFDSLQSGIAKFLDQTDADGQPISVEPRFLLVPTALKFKAIELVKGATLVVAGDTNVVRPAMNSIVGENLEVVSSPYLANTTYTGYSTTAWYLFGDPRQTDTFELGFLRGKRTPTVERGETDYTTLGLWFRVYFDVGVREQGFRGMVKAAGI